LILLSLLPVYPLLTISYARCFTLLCFC
jgi:hypothetical protein